MPPGTRLGPYELVALIGAGGMGEVYRARDTRLDRDVAVKILASGFSADAERLARFEREAKAIAALSHPNILAIHDFGTHDGTAYAVMELLDGESLRSRLASGPLPVRKAVEYGAQIGTGLAAAHDKGIIHRDIKPENLFATTDGRVRILDFGLAKAHGIRGRTDTGVGPYSHGGPDSDATPTALPTDPGTVLGTVGYLSPEQARGQAADHRSDIFSLGCVLYEMLAGRRAFKRETAPETMTAVLREDPPPLSTDAHALPAAVERVVQHCLEKRPEDRFQSARDLAFALQAVTGSDTGSGALPVAATARSPRFALPWAVAAVMALVAVGLSVRIASRPAPTPQAVQRHRVVLPAPLADDNFDRAIAISRDGTQLAFTGRVGATTRLFYRRIDALDFQPLPGTEGAIAPFFSPDGRWIGFAAAGRIKRIQVSSQQIEAVSVHVGSNMAGHVWGDDGQIYFCREWSGGVSRIAGLGAEGVSEPVLAPDPEKRERGVVWPQWVADRNLLLFTAFAGDIQSMNESRITMSSSKDPRSRWMLATRGTCARLLPTGHVVYGLDGNLLAASVDLAGPRAGDPVVAVKHVQMFDNTGVAQYAVSDTGTLVYLGGDISGSSDAIVRIDRKGLKATLAQGKRALGWPSVSGDGTKLLVTGATANDDIEVYPLPDGPFTRVTFDDGDEKNPVWAPGGQRFAYTSTAKPVAQMYLRNVDGRGVSTPLFPGDYSRFPGSFSTDGSRLVFVEQHPKTGYDIWWGTLGPGGQARSLINSPSAEGNPALSPDGRWLAYQSDESGRGPEIYVVRFPEGTDRNQVSENGGSEPRWAPHGDEFYYRNGRDVVAVSVHAGTSFVTGSRQTLFRVDDSILAAVGFQNGSYNAMPDGRGFVFVDMSKRTPLGRELVIVQNWFEELKALVPAIK